VLEVKVSTIVTLSTVLIIIHVHGAAKIIILIKTAGKLIIGVAALNTREGE